MKVTIQQKIAMAALGSATLLFLACGSGTVTDPDTDASGTMATMFLENAMTNPAFIDSMMTECANGTVKCTEGGDTEVPSSSSTDASSADAASSSGAAVASSSSTAVVASSSSTAPIASSSSVKASSSSAAVVSSSSSTPSSSSATVSSSSEASNTLSFTYSGAARTLTANVEYTATFSAASYAPTVGQGKLVCYGTGSLTMSKTSADTTVNLENDVNKASQLTLTTLSATLLSTGGATCEQKW